MNQKIEDIEKQVAEMLQEVDCEGIVPFYTVKQFCVCYFRWLECEDKNTVLGLLAKHPSGAAVESPYVKMGLEYMREASGFWNKIQNSIKEETKRITYERFMEMNKIGGKTNGTKKS